MAVGHPFTFQNHPGQLRQIQRLADLLLAHPLLHRLLAVGTHIRKAVSVLHRNRKGDAHRALLRLLHRQVDVDFLYLPQLCLHLLEQLLIDARPVQHQPDGVHPVDPWQHPDRGDPRIAHRPIVVKGRIGAVGHLSVAVQQPLAQRLVALRVLAGEDWLRVAHRRNPLHRRHHDAEPARGHVAAAARRLAADGRLHLGLPGLEHRLLLGRIADAAGRLGQKAALRDGDVRLRRLLAGKNRRPSGIDRLLAAEPPLGGVHLQRLTGRCLCKGLLLCRFQLLLQQRQLLGQHRKADAHIRGAVHRDAGALLVGLLHLLQKAFISFRHSLTPPFKN